MVKLHGSRGAHHQAHRSPKSSSNAWRTWTVYGLFTLLAVTNVTTLVALVMSPDIARLINGQNDTILSAYEDRIADLRIEVDRLHSRQYARAGDLNLQLQELVQQQEILTEQHQYVRALVEKAEALGITAPPVPGPAAKDYATLEAGSTGPAPTGGDLVVATAGEVEAMMTETRDAMTAISTAAAESTDKILAELSRLGIRPSMPSDTASAMGGPFLPAESDVGDATMLSDANAVLVALERFKVARGAIDAAPIHRPISINARQSSGYGTRRDPFLGRMAFHSGLDFAMPSGTIVLSAGAGTVSYVGTRSGYGNVVEIDHGGGLVSRYAHLSAQLVKKGQVVDVGSPIARVGTTGRSTGPHLHFEVRRDDKPLDPAGFLAVGTRLEQFVVVG